MLAPLLYLPVILWLVFVTVANYSSWRISTGLAFVFFFGLTATNSLLNGFFPALIAASCAFVIGLILAYANVASRGTTILLAVTLASLPVSQWWVLLPGLIAAVAVSAYRIRRTAGAGYLSMIAGETYAGIGMQGSILSGEKPDLSRIPLLPSSDKETEEMVETEKTGEDTLLGSVGRIKIRLAPYLLGSVVLVAVIAFFSI